MSISSSQVMREASESFDFMGLPAEIRNTIYDMCVTASEDDNIDDCMLLAHVGPGHSAVDRLALTRVDRLIRHEYQPLIMRPTAFAVPATHLNKFLDTFYPVDGAENEKIKEYQGAISVLISRQTPNTFDMMQLVKLCRASSRFTAKFACPPHQPSWKVDEVQRAHINNLNDLLAKLVLLDDTDATLTAVQAQKIEIHIPNISRRPERPSLITLVFSSKDQQPWMNDKLIHKNMSSLRGPCLIDDVDAETFWKASPLWVMSDGSNPAPGSEREYLLWRVKARVAEDL
ncbi:hypothetical protein ACN47E_004234 [Coniothyrium glycines]